MKISFNKTIRRMYKIIKEYKKQYFLIILFCLLAALFNSIAPYFLGLVTDTLFEGVKNKIGIDEIYILKILLIILICYLINSVCTYFKSFLASELGQKIGYDLRNKLADKINRIKVSSLDQMKKGDVISKITNDVERLTDNITEIIPDLVYNFALIIGSVIMMFVLSKVLAFLTITVIPITYFLLSYIVKKTQKYFELNQRAIGSVNAFVEESVTNNDIIKSFNKEKYFNKKFNKESRKLANYGFVSSFYSSLAVPFNKFIGNINYIVVVGVGSIFVINGKLRLGAIQSFIQYMKDFNRPMNTIAQVISNLQMAVASVDRVYEILDIKEEAEDGNIEKFDFKNSIEFKNVTFSYFDSHNVLKNVSFEIKKGQKVAIVGKTGSGKTTIINLFMRFYNTYKGEILIDGVNIKDIKKEAYRKMISLVLQDTWLFEGTIKDNILFDKVISDEKLSRVLSDSKTKHIINSLPDGLNHEINEETDNLSTGEKQLLTIARALANDSSILVLDEATSSVDTRLEYLINSSLKELMKDKTSIVIAHRLSTIVNSDMIIVIKDGRIYEMGTHKSLLKQKGYYYKLYTSGFDIDEVKDE